MKLKYMLLIPLAVTLMAVAQEKPPASVPLNETARVAVLQARLRQKSIETDYLRLQTQLTQLESQYSAAGKSLQDAIDAAYVAAKLDHKEWTLDVEKLEFAPVSKPVTPPAVPVASKAAPTTTPAPK